MALGGALIFPMRVAKEIDLNPDSYKDETPVVDFIQVNFSGEAPVTDNSVFFGTNF